MAHNVPPYMNQLCTVALNDDTKTIDCRHALVQRDLWCDSCKMFYKLNDNGYLPQESIDIEYRATESLAKDPERALLALKVSTSEALVKRARPYSIGNERR